MSSSDLVPIVHDDKSNRQVVGLGIITASMFLAGEMAGSGVLALPRAIVLTGKQYNIFLVPNNYLFKKQMQKY